MRRLWLAVSLLYCAGFGARHLAAQGAALDGISPGSDEATLIEFRVGRLIARTVMARREGQEILLPLQDILHLVEVPLQRTGPAQWRLGAVGDRPPVDLDFARRRIGSGRHARAAPANAFVIFNSEPYVGVAEIGMLLGVDLITEWDDLTVVVVDPAPLPVAARLRRALLRRAAAEGDNSETVVAIDIASPRSRIGGLVIDYAVQAPLGAPNQGTAAWNLGVGSEAFGGGVVVAIGHGAATGNRVDASWSRAWSGSRGVAQLNLGDGLSTGPHTRSVRGVAVSNAPLARADDYGILGVAGSLALGWDVEAWRGGRVVAHDSVNASGRFHLDVPVQYGDNPVEFVAYGPDGEVRRFSRAWGIHPDAVPVGQLIYGLAAGACRGPECMSTWNADLRYGLAAGWTVRAGFDRFSRDAAPGLNHPYAALYGTLPMGFSVELNAVARAVAQAQLSWAPAEAIRFSVTAAHFDTSVVAPILTAAGRRSQFTSSIVWHVGAAALDATIDHYATGSGAVTNARAVASLPVAGIQWLVSAASSGDANSGGPTWNGLTVGIDAIGVRIASSMLRVGADLSAVNGVQRVRAAVTLPLSPAFRIDAGLNWAAGSQQPQLTAMIVGDLPFLRSTTGVASGTSAVAQSLQGSLLVDASRGKITPRGLPAVARAGLTGRACLDQDGDGRCSATEPGIAGIRITAGGMLAVTDADGRWTLWDLAPYAATIVTLDTTSLAAPYLVPPFINASVTPAANRLLTLDLPIVEGSVIEGVVTREGGEPVSGLLLRIRRIGGAELRSVRTFSDGGFYAIGLRTGRWEVTPDAAELAALHTAAGALSVDVPKRGNGAAASQLHLVLHNQ